MARKRLLSSLGLLAGLGLMLPGCSSPSNASSTSRSSSTTGTSQNSSAAKPSSTTKAKASNGAINTLCPMSGIPINPKVPTADYAGHKIGFCSNRCEAAWNKFPKAKRDAFVAKNK